jgi:hypothetical protein
MQGLAGGGIVAFSTGNLVRGQEESFEDFRRRLFDAELQAQRDANAASDQEREAERQRYLAAQGENNRVPPSPFFNRAPLPALKKSAVALAPSAALNTDSRPYPEPSLAASKPALAGIENIAGVQAPAGPKLKLDGSGAGGAGATQGGDLTSLLKKIQAAQGEPTDPEAASRKQLQASAEAMAGKELANAQTSKEGLAALLGGKESRIKGREDRAEKAENLNAKMAVINAGLAMMQSTGRGLAGIAEGATKGMGMYSEGLKLTAAERQKIEDAKDSFDDLRFNSENMSRKEITAAENKITNAANITIQGGMDARTKDRSEKREDSSKIFTAEAAARQGELNRAVQIQAAGMPSGQMQLALALGKGDVEAGMRKITEIAAGKFNIQQAYADHLKTAGPGMGMTPQDFAAAMKAFTPVDVSKASLLARPSGG